MIDVLIIGAGPAGLAAAITCREQELGVLVIDEFMKPGGRLLGQLHQEPSGEWWNGIEETEKLLKRLEELGGEMQCGCSVHHIEKQDAAFIVHTNNQEIRARLLLIATGAGEVPLPIPGWTLPGVMSIGAAQVMTNVHRVRVGSKGVIIGVNVLSAAIARELQLADIEMHSMVLPAMNIVNERAADPRKVMDALSKIAHLAPSAFIRFGSKLMKAKWMRDLVVRFFPARGVKLWGIPVQLRKAAIRINGSEQAESVTICNITADGKPIPGSEQTIEADFVCIAGGLYPLAELAYVAGCPFRYVEELGGHVPVHNDRMETPIEGLFVAGNITGIESAKVAIAQGSLAGLSMSKRLKPDKQELEHRLLEAVETVNATRRNASIQFHSGIEHGRKVIAQAFKEHMPL